MMMLNAINFNKVQATAIQTASRNLPGGPVLALAVQNLVSPPVLFFGMGLGASLGRSDAVSAGIINTPMHSPEAHQMLVSLHPMGRMGDVSDIVGAIMYLESARFVSGEILHVDGGQAAGHHAISRVAS
jgi:enoyl-[acyl-carrier-protein] reductase (NADH)